MLPLYRAHHKFSKEKIEGYIFKQQGLFYIIKDAVVDTNLNYFEQEYNLEDEDLIKIIDPLTIEIKLNGEWRSIDQA